MSNLTSPKLSPDTRKKKSALPSLLSNLRNAQAAAFGGSASDHEREVRPLVANSPQLQQRNVPSNSLASTIQSFSQRFGSDWHKRGKRKKGKGVTLNIPTGFYYAVGCFFILFPLFFLVYILARHSVFGDEGDTTSTTKHIHEVPATLVTGGVSFEAGKDSVVVDINYVDGVVNSEAENEIQGVGINDNAVKELDVSTLRNPSINLPPPSDTVLTETETKDAKDVQDVDKAQVDTAEQSSGVVTPDKSEVMVESETKDIKDVQDVDKAQVDTVDQSSGVVTPDKSEVMIDTPDKVVKADKSNESVAADDTTTKLQSSNGEVSDTDTIVDSKPATSELKEDVVKDVNLPMSDESNAIIESKSGAEVLEDTVKEKIAPEEPKVASAESDVVSASEKKEEVEKEASLQQQQVQTEEGSDTASSAQKLQELEKKLEQQSIEIENLKADKKAEPMDAKEMIKKDEAISHGNLRRLQL